MDGERTVYWIGEVPTHCQLSNRKINGTFVDGRIPGRSTWANMHPTYFRQIGGAFGTGCGQLFERQTDGRWLKVEG